MEFIKQTSMNVLFMLAFSASVSIAEIPLQVGPNENTVANPDSIAIELNEEYAALRLPKSRMIEFNEGMASWYGPGFHGRKTANGEIYNQYALTAAHRTLPFNTMVRVENLNNGKSVIVRINDRGPYVGKRVIDVSKKVAEELDMINTGLARVKLHIVDPKPTFTPIEYFVEKFTIQVGSFSKKEQASEISKDLKGSRVFEVIDGSTTYFRIYYGLFATRREAEDELTKILEQGHSGFVKQL
jgi:rare lipoprotein A